MSAIRTISASSVSAFWPVPREQHVPPPLRVAEDPVAHLGGEVQPAAVVLEHLHHADRLHHVVEAARRPPRSRSRSPAWPNGVWPRSWPITIASTSISFSRSARAIERADLRDLERVGEPGPVVVAPRREEHLRLPGEAPERLAVDEAVAVALEDGPLVVGRLRPGARPATRAERAARGWSVRSSSSSSISRIVPGHASPAAGGLPHRPAAARALSPVEARLERRDEQVRERVHHDRGDEPAGALAQPAEEEAGEEGGEPPRLEHDEVAGREEQPASRGSPRRAARRGRVTPRSGARARPARSASTPGRRAPPAARRRGAARAPAGASAVRQPEREARRAARTARGRAASAAGEVRAGAPA